MNAYEGEAREIFCLVSRPFKIVYQSFDHNFQCNSFAICHNKKQILFTKLEVTLNLQAYKLNMYGKKVSLDF